MWCACVCDDEEKKSINTFETHFFSVFVQKITRNMCSMLSISFLSVFPCRLLGYHFSLSIFFCSVRFGRETNKKKVDWRMIGFDWGRWGVGEGSGRLGSRKRRRRLAYCSINGYPRESWHLGMNPFSRCVIPLPTMERERAFSVEGVLFSMERSVLQPTVVMRKIRSRKLGLDWWVGKTGTTSFLPWIFHMWEHNLLIIYFLNDLRHCLVCFFFQNFILYKCTIEQQSFYTFWDNNKNIFQFRVVNEETIQFLKRLQTRKEQHKKWNVLVPNTGEIVRSLVTIAFCVAAVNAIRLLERHWV